MVTMAKYRPDEFDTRENWMFDIENFIAYLLISLSPIMRLRREMDGVVRDAVAG